MATMDLDKLAELSDEEISKLSSVEVPVIEEKANEVEETTTETVEALVEDSPIVEVPLKVEEPVVPKLVDPAKKDTPDALQEQKVAVVEDKKLTVEETPAEQQKQAEVAAAPSLVDYKGAYGKIMAPFKANGKTIQLESVDEAIQLMQMGANYTKKMQEMQGVRKYVMMLQNNGLLDEEKLSFLIDLDKRNPEAIKKLLVDAKIDPLEFDVTKQNYRNNGSHTVSNEEVALNSAIEDLNSQDGGKETLASVHEWDQASKKTLWENPDVLKVIHTQRANGVYAKITTEMDRRQALGQIPANTPFLAAYKKIGDDLAARGAFNQQSVSGTPVAVRTVSGKTPSTRAVDPRLKAAAPTRTSPRTTQGPINYLALSDEEFAKLPPPR